MSDIAPDPSPFGAETFARFWDGWRGRTCEELEVSALRSYYIRRSIGPLCTRAAMPFGLPIFRDDFAVERASWVRAFFSLRGTLRASLSLYSAPRHVYPGVAWTAQERHVVGLDAGWRSHLKPGVLRRSRLAAEAAWEVRPLVPDEVRRAARAVTETERRHGGSAGFGAEFCARMLETVRGGPDARAIGAVREGEIGAFRMVIVQGDYQISWLLCSTDAALRDHVGPFLTYRWLEQSAEAGCRYIDLGASPTPGVAKFKASFGARPAYLYTGLRGLHLVGS